MIPIVLFLLLLPIEAFLWSWSKHYSQTSLYGRIEVEREGNGVVRGNDPYLVEWRGIEPTLRMDG